MLKEQDYQPKILYAAKLSIKNGDVWILNYFVHGNSKGLKKQRQTNKQKQPPKTNEFSKVMRYKINI